MELLKCNRLTSVLRNQETKATLSFVISPSRIASCSQEKRIWVDFKGKKVYTGYFPRPCKNELHIKLPKAFY